MTRKKPVEVTDQHRKVAQDYLSGKKTLEQAMTDNGFCAAYGRLGIKRVSEVSGPFREAFNEELDAVMRTAEGAHLEPDRLGKLATWRLAVNLARGKDEATHSAKLVGSMKAIDLFVRSGENPTGLFLSLAGDPKVSAAIEELAAKLPKDAPKGEQS
jgi:hypothetical protein